MSFSTRLAPILALAIIGVAPHAHPTPPLVAGRPSLDPDHAIITRSKPASPVRRQVERERAMQIAVDLDASERAEPIVSADLDWTSHFAPYAIETRSSPANGDAWSIR